MFLLKFKIAPFDTAFLVFGKGGFFYFDFPIREGAVDRL